MPKKILYIHYVPNLCGAATSLALLIKYLDRARFVPHVLLTHPKVGDARDFFESIGVPVDHIPVNLIWDRPWYDYTNISSKAWKAFHPDSKILAYLEKIRPDIVHLNDFLPVTVAITASMMGIPVVWHCRHVILNKRPVLDPGRRIIREMVTRANQIIAISESEAVQFCSKKVVVIYNPLEVEKLVAIQGQGREIRTKLGIGEDEYVVMAPIPLREAKGAWDFVRACGLVKNILPDIQFRFLLVGSTPSPGRRHLLRKWTGWLGPEAEMDKFWRLAKKLRISDNLMVTGFRKDVYAIMDASDLVLFPSHLQACGRQCFEAGAMRKPIIVTLPDENTKVVLDGQTGLIIPDKRPDLLGEAIANLARHPEDGKRMGEAGFEYVSHLFRAEDHAKKIMKVYDEILTDRL